MTSSDFVDVEAGVHGGIVESEMEALGIDPNEVLDFSVSTNPFGPPASALEAAANARMDRYPDRSAHRLRKAISAREGIPQEMVIVGNGAMQLIWAIAFAHLKGGGKALVLEPTFGEYEVASRLAGGEVIRFPTDAADGFRLDVDRLERALKDAEPDVVWICNPNNPTGEYLPPPVLSRLYRAAGKAIFVVDEAYASFLPEFEPLQGPERLVRLRSMTKEYGVPGLRLGYAIASTNMARRLRRFVPPWSVNSIALEVGVALLNDGEFLQNSIPRLLEESSRLRRSISILGWDVVQSQMHYFLVRVGNAGEFRRRMLLERKILVRDCASFGLPDHIRISTRLPEENDFLLSALEEVRG